MQDHPSAAVFPGPEGEPLRETQTRAVAAVRDWNARLGPDADLAGLLARRRHQGDRRRRAGPAPGPVPADRDRPLLGDRHPLHRAAAVRRPRQRHRRRASPTCCRRRRAGAAGPAPTRSSVVAAGAGRVGSVRAPPGLRLRPARPVRRRHRRPARRPHLLPAGQRPGPDGQASRWRRSRWRCSPSGSRSCSRRAPPGRRGRARPGRPPSSRTPPRSTRRSRRSSGSARWAWRGTASASTVVVEALAQAAEGRRPRSSRSATTTEGPDALRVRMHRGCRPAFVARAQRVVAAGRPPCPLCGLPLDPDGPRLPAPERHRALSGRCGAAERRVSRAAERRAGSGLGRDTGPGPVTTTLDLADALRLLRRAS